MKKDRVIDRKRWRDRSFIIHIDRKKSYSMQARDKQIEKRQRN